MRSEAAAPTDVEELYLELGPFAVSKTGYLVGRQDVAEEIVQEVFLRLLQRPVQFPTRKHAYAWVYTACHNAGIDYLRSQRRRGTVSLSDAGVPELVAPEDPASRLQNRAALEAVFARLGEREARIVAYRFIDGAGVKDIAERLAVSEKTVQRALRSAEQALTDVRRKHRGA